MGYDLNRAYWGQGIMNRALRMVLQFAFEQVELNRVEALVIPGNEASESLLLKLGFRAEGILREYAYFKAKHRDLQIFSLLKSSYERAGADSQN